MTTDPQAVYGDTPRCIGRTPNSGVRPSIRAMESLAHRDPSRMGTDKQVEIIKVSFPGGWGSVESDATWLLTGLSVGCSCLSIEVSINPSIHPSMDQSMIYPSDRVNKYIQSTDSVSISLSQSFYGYIKFWLVLWLPFFIFPLILGIIIIPIDELIFFRGVAQPPTRIISINFSSCARWVQELFTFW